MNFKKIALYIGCTFLLAACSQTEKANTTKIISIKNTLDVNRNFETIELSKASLKVEDLSTIGLKEVGSGQLQVTQLVDNDGDGVMDQILFQPKIAANSEAKFEVTTIANSDRPKSEELCYSRFVPERVDDYAWENNKVAYRIFGPKAQQMTEAGIEGGNLTSGVDAWLKRVEYPIINKWYKEHIAETRSYHDDTGEGADNYNLGTSRGVGGLAVKVDTTYYFSKNFTKSKTITTGPIRTSFYLEYANWDAAGKTIKESRIVSLDLGQYLSKYELSIEGTDQISAGLNLHEKKGKLNGNIPNGWLSYWEPNGDSEMGTAILADQSYFKDFESYNSALPNLSHAYANLKINNNKITYYTGMGCKEPEHFASNKAWENYLNTFSRNIKNPLKVTIVN